MRSHLIYLLLFAFFLSCSSSHPEFEVENREEVIIRKFENVIVDNLPDNRSISGAIIKGDKIIWSKAYGTPSLTTFSLANTTTIYRIASISKTFTAFLMMLLVQDSIIKLDDPVELFLPEIKKLSGYSDDTKITFQQLATHTAGLMREASLSSAASGPIEEWESNVLQAIPSTSFESKPGEQFSYSNIGYGILGLSLSRAAQKPFIELVEERIFKPLDMNSTFFAVPKEKLSALSVGYHNLFNGQIDTKTPLLAHDGLGYGVPSGGLYSTPNDLAKFVIYNMGGSSNLVSDENLAMMQSKIIGIGEHNYYGIGLFVDQEDHLTIIHHGGALPGYRAKFAFAKKKKYGVILMRNYFLGDPNLKKVSFELLEALNKIED